MSVSGQSDSTSTSIGLNRDHEFVKDTDVANDVDTMIIGPLRDGAVFDEAFFEDTEVTVGSTTIRMLKYIDDSEALVSAKYSNTLYQTLSGDDIHFNDGKLNLFVVSAADLPTAVLTQNYNEDDFGTIAETPVGSSASVANTSALTTSAGHFNSGYFPQTINQGDYVLWAFTFHTVQDNNSTWRNRYFTKGNHSILGVEVDIHYTGNLATLTLDTDGTVTKRSHFGNVVSTVEMADTDFVKQYVDDHAGDAHLVDGNAGYGLNIDTEGAVDILSVDTEVIIKDICRAPAGALQISRVRIAVTLKSMSVLENLSTIQLGSLGTTLISNSCIRVRF